LGIGHPGRTGRQQVAFVDKTNGGGKSALSNNITPAASGYFEGVRGRNSALIPQGAVVNKKAAGQKRDHRHS
jgi:hypothetical protein